jgi:PAS domain S-box-containing protein
MRDLVALSTLPAIWVGLGPEGVARSLADALLNTLSLDLIYVRLVGPDGSAVFEEARTKRGGGSIPLEAVKGALAPFFEALSTESSIVIPNPIGESALNATITRFGIGGENGILIAASKSTSFPTDQDRLLLGVAANQTAIVMQRRRAEQEVRDQQEWLRVTLASIGDAVIATDTKSRVVFVNEIATKLMGLSQQEAIGQPLPAILNIVNEDTGETIANPVDKVLQDQTIVGLANHTILISKDGTKYPIDDSAAPIKNDAGELIGVILTFRDVTEPRQIERHRNTRLAITSVLSDADTWENGATATLRAVCEHLQWELGFFWIIDEAAGNLRCSVSSQSSDIAAHEFIDESCRRHFSKGEGLPGRVWASELPSWILDIEEDANFPRLSSAVGYGLHSAFAHPIKVGERMLGIVEFFTKKLRTPDAGLLETMATVTGNLGQFIERKAAEIELRRSEWELSDFFDNATTALHWVAADGVILRANQAELDMLGYTREEYVGRPIAEFHVDNQVICDILKRLASGEKLNEYPSRLRCKDGSIKDVLIDSSVLWNDGKFVHTRCFTRDVTERRRAEAALADARSRLAAALKAGAIATWTWDIPSNKLFADESLARLFNVELPGGDGAPLDLYVKAIHAEDWPQVSAALTRSVESGDDYDADYRVIRPDGSVRWVTARGRVEKNALGEPARMVGVLVDITERKRLEDELREADQRKDEFLATLAHELRNPLAPIQNSLQILKMPHVDEKTVQQTREMMERQIQHLVRLVDDLLDVSRVMRGKIELRKEPIELGTVIARAVETVQPLIDIQGHRLEVQISTESLKLVVDPVRLAQVLGNLLTNSAKYTDPPGRIWLIAERDGDEAVVRVKDNGIGIAPDMLPHVFELFVQADHATTRAQGGLGIGLTLVKNLEKLHGGSITALSDGLNKGSEFCVRLPLAAINSEQGGTNALRHLQKVETRSGYKLLVVDDNRDSAISLSRLLGLQGHDVQVAHDGISALEAAIAFQPALVFLDIGMPGMDGYAVARRLRKIPGLERTILAALTGWGQEEDRRRTAEAGFDHHLVKPIESKSLENLLASLER